MALKVTTEGLTEGEIAEVIGCRVGAVGLREVGASVRTTHVAEGPAEKNQSAEVSHSPRRIETKHGIQTVTSNPNASDLFESYQNRVGIIVDNRLAASHHAVPGGFST
jgi:hypothetical protein